MAILGPEISQETELELQAGDSVCLDAAASRSGAPDSALQRNKN